MILFKAIKFQSSFCVILLIIKIHYSSLTSQFINWNQSFDNFRHSSRLPHFPSQPVPIVRCGHPTPPGAAAGSATSNRCPPSSARSSSILRPKAAKLPGSSSPPSDVAAPAFVRSCCATTATTTTAAPTAAAATEPRATFVERRLAHALLSPGRDEPSSSGFYSTFPTRAQCYETFSVRNLLIFCLSLASLYSLVWCLQVRPEPTRVKPFRVLHFSILRKSVNYGGKRF
jgi:hypothetical protein